MRFAICILVFSLFSGITSYHFADNFLQAFLMGIPFGLAGAFFGILWEGQP